LAAEALRLTMKRLGSICASLLTWAVACGPKLMEPVVAVLPHDDSARHLAPISLPPRLSDYAAQQAICNAADEMPLRPCQVLKVRALGGDGRGRLLAVALVFRGNMNDADTSKALGWQLDKNADEFSRISPDCERYQYWALAYDNGEEVFERNKLLSICNEGHGAAGVGTDRVTFIAGHKPQLRYETNGGSNWRFAESTIIDLAPRRVSSKWSEGYWILGYNSESIRWDYVAFMGKSIWKSPLCNKQRLTKNQNEKAEVRTSWAIPQLSPNGPFVKQWRSVSLGGCAAHIDGRTAGATLSGHPQAKDASFRAVVVGHTLFVDAYDDRVVEGGKVVDTLEIYGTTDRVSYMSHCIDPDLGRVQSLRIKVSNGEIDPSSTWATPKRRALVSKTSNEKLRVQVALPKDLRGLTVAYRDTDDGVRYERVIASSDFDEDDYTTLGVLSSIRRDLAGCEIRRGRFEPFRRVLSEPFAF
jgi:hypothetical protein